MLMEKIKFFQWQFNQGIDKQKLGENINFNVISNLNLGICQLFPILNSASSNRVTPLSIQFSRYISGNATEVFSADIPRQSIFRFELGISVPL